MNLYDHHHISFIINSNLSTLYLRNGLFIMRCCLQHVIQLHGEKGLMVQLEEPSVDGGMLRVLAHGVIAILGEIPLVWVVHVLWFTFMSCLPIISTVSCFTVFLEVVCIPACTYVMIIMISIGPLHMTFTLKPSMYYWYCCPVRYTVAILLPVWWWRKWWVFPSELIKRDTCEFIIIILTCLHVLYAIIYGPRDCIKYFQQSSTVHLLYCGVHYYSQTHVLCGSTDSNEPHCVPTTSPSWPPAVTPNWTSCLYNMSV